MKHVLNSEQIPHGFKNWLELYSKAVNLNNTFNKIIVEERKGELITTFEYDIAYLKDKILEDYKNTLISKSDATALKYIIDVSISVSKEVTSTTNLWTAKAESLIKQIIDNLTYYE